MQEWTKKGVIKAMKIQEVILKAMGKEILWSEAADMIGVSYRTMKRWKARYLKEGYDGIMDRRMERPSPKRIPMKELQKVLTLYREGYTGFSVKHFHEYLAEEHRIHWSYTWVKRVLQESGLVPKYKMRGKHRIRRSRRSMAGMMLHLDGSTHEWLRLLPGKNFDLLVLMDDATNEIYEMRLVEQEDTLGCMEVLRDCIAEKGLFCSLYTDRATHFFWTPDTGGKVKEYHLTQVGRALERDCNIRLIPAYSPQARGRSERMNGTLQGRLPQELKRAGIMDLEKANEYLKNVYLARHNRLFKVKPDEEASVFIPIAHPLDLERIFSIQEPRVVNHDNTVHFRNMILQIKASPLRVSFAKCHVLVHEHIDKTLSISYGPHILGRYDDHANPLVQVLGRAA